jgi:chemotaxis protein MotB
MSRRKKAHGGNHERWLVSYADFITLLFAFFVVMFASSQVDQRKVGKLAMAIQVAFQQMGVFSASNTKVPLNTSEPMPFSDTQAIENAMRTAPLGRIVPENSGPLSATPGIPNIQQLQEDLEQALFPELQRQEVAIGIHGGELVISLREIGFFDSGSAGLRPGAMSTLTRIAMVLAERPYRLRIEGHTDSIPIHNARFASNWELSTARATEIIRLLISRYQFAPARLSAGGYAEYHPIASNDTPEGRSLNRRVDIVVVTPMQSNATSQSQHPPTPSASGPVNPDGRILTEASHTPPAGPSQREN